MVETIAPSKQRSTSWHTSDDALEEGQVDWEQVLEEIGQS